MLGGHRTGSLAALDGIAFVAQDTPLYKNLSAADLLHVTRNLNRHFDEDYASSASASSASRCAKRPEDVGGQQAQLALTLALARRPLLLVLDEPMAMLDPRRSARLHGHGDDSGRRRRRLGCAVVARPRRARTGSRLPRARFGRQHPDGGRGR